MDVLNAIMVNIQIIISVLKEKGDLYVMFAMTIIIFFKMVSVIPVILLNLDVTDAK